MSASRIVSTETANLRLVAGVNGARRGDFHAFIKPDLESAAVSLTIDVVSPSGRAEVLARLAPEFHKEAEAALSKLAPKVTAARAKLPNPGRGTDPPSEAVDVASLCEAARALVTLEDIPKSAVGQLHALGVAGESAQLELLFLAVVSRLVLPPLRPVSVVVKCVSSSGKSFLVEQTLRLFPADAYHFMTAMSERALVYDTAPLSHRMLVFAEATGADGSELQELLVRSLLSEGRLVYPYVHKDEESGKMTTTTIEREGPTGLVLTTTRAAVHPENETRLLSLSVTETPEQTRAVFRATASRVKGGAAITAHDFSSWHALQHWLAASERRVAIPYIDDLAELTDNRAVRMRRDFTTVLALITARAMLHQATRDRAPDGSIIATFADYAAVRSLVAELVSHGIQASVPEKIRTAVKKVAEVYRPPDVGSPEKCATVQDVATALSVEKSAAHDWVKRAIHAGYLVNIETRKRQPAKLRLGDPLPSDTSALPTLEHLSEAFRTRIGSGSPTGTPNDDSLTSSRRVPQLQCDSGASAPAVGAPHAALSSLTLETTWNGGTEAQTLDCASPNVPASDPEPHWNQNDAVEVDGIIYHADGSSELTPERLAEEQRKRAERRAEREALEGGL